MLCSAMYLIAILVLFALLGVFAMQNGGTQDFTLLGYTWNLPTWAPTAIGTIVASVLLLLHMSHAGLGARFREAGHGRTLHEHRGFIEELRSENARLREQLAAARGAAEGAGRPRRTWTDELRDLPNRVRNRTTV
jgi:uncharacterized integral membrane protein